ncbi:MAG TPA: TetR/AcrR family transcriptional regulator [Pirellulales bacterium]|nr:TetR/AcrR family transcriptional regulator [Pirellulales bacterium]
MLKNHPSPESPASSRAGRPVNEELRERRREEILAAAVKLFAGHGYAAADTQALADALSIGKGTLYRYFPSKEALFLAAVDRGMRQLSEAIDRSVAEIADPLDQIRAALHTYLAFFEERPEVVELMIQERAQFKDRKRPTYFEHRQSHIGRWQEVYRGLAAAGRVRDLPAERVHDVIGDLMYGTMFTNYVAGRRRPLRQQAQDIVDLIFCGILSESERDREVGIRKLETKASGGRQPPG